MNRHAYPGPLGDVREARRLFPATDGVAYFNTAAVGLASRVLVDAYRRYIDDWAATGLDYVRGEAAGERARGSVAALIGADPSDMALIASVSAAAGLVASSGAPAADRTSSSVSASTAPIITRGGCSPATAMRSARCRFEMAGWNPRTSPGAWTAGPGTRRPEQRA